MTGHGSAATATAQSWSTWSGSAQSTYSLTAMPPAWSVGGASTPAWRSSAEITATLMQTEPSAAHRKAVQVADRWHLLKNLTEALERVLASKPAQIRQAHQTTVRPTPAPERADPAKGSAATAREPGAAAGAL